MFPSRCILVTGSCWFSSCYHQNQPHDLQAVKVHVCYGVIEWNEPVLSQVRFNIMIRNFFKIFPEFTLFCFLFVAKSSFGNFHWRISQDPAQPAICSRSWNGEKKTQLVYAGKHIVKPIGNDVVWRKVAMSQCHNPHFANLLRFAIAWRGRDRFRSQRKHPVYRTSCTTCLRMVSQGNEQIQEKLRRHHLSVSERCSLATSS